MRISDKLIRTERNFFLDGNIDYPCYLFSSEFTHSMNTYNLVQCLCSLDIENCMSDISEYKNIFSEKLTSKEEFLIKLILR